MKGKKKKNHHKISSPRNNPLSLVFDGHRMYKQEYKQMGKNGLKNEITV